MGDYFQTIVDKQASIDEVDNLDQKIIAWLVNSGIVLPTRTDCVLSNGGMGYAPGPNFRDVVEILIQIDPEYPNKQIIIDHDLESLRTNGLAVIKKRTVFHSGQGSMEIICPQCQTAFDHKTLKNWSGAVDEWYGEMGEGIIACSSCGHSETVTEWQYDPPWGFGNLGFKFWNWPPLLPSFVEEVGKQLGHEIIFVYGKL